MEHISGDVGGEKLALSEARDITRGATATVLVITYLQDNIADTEGHPTFRIISPTLSGNSGRHPNNLPRSGTFSKK